MSNYLRLCKGLADKGVLVPPNDLYNLVDPEHDYYSSVFFYNDSHFKRFKETGTIKGIKDVTTNRLIWDFDNKFDPEVARQEALGLVNYLNKNYNIPTDDIEVYYSGNKGYNVAITLDRYITPEEAYNLAVLAHGKDFKTLDKSLYDAPQIIRIAGTRHQKTGLFKIPITYKQLQTLNTEQIKNLALSLDNIEEVFNWKAVSPKATFFIIPKQKEEVKKSEYSLDLKNKPTGWKNCKWSLLQGNFKAGERHEALLVIAATARGLGFDKEQTYYLCKSALKKQSVITGQDEFSKEELWDNIIEQTVFSDGWEGGQYTCQKQGWLQSYCHALGQDACPKEEDEKPVIQAEEMGKTFEDYAVNFEKNIVQTGIKGLDENVMFLASTHNGILGQPGAGKTSLALEYLHNTSKQGIQSTFLSLDMGVPIIFAKMIQKMIGCSFKEAMRIFREEPTKKAELLERIKEEYKNVGFNFRSGLTVPDIKKIIQEQEQLTGKKTKLLITDYLECLAGPYSDPTANFGFISNQMKDLANDLNICSVLLLQTQKHSTSDISDPILTMKAIKGSSVIEQSCSVVLTLWREGYNPKTVMDDKYVSFAAVKNRFGSLWSDDFSWDGVRGNIRGLAEEERYQLADFRERKIQAKAAAEEMNKWS